MSKLSGYMLTMYLKGRFCVLCGEDTCTQDERTRACPLGHLQVQRDKTWVLNKLHKLPSNTEPSLQQYISHPKESDILSGEFHISMGKK